MEEQAAGRAEEPCGPAEGGSGAERGWAGGGGGDWMATHPTVRQGVRWGRGTGRVGSARCVGMEAEGRTSSRHEVFGLAVLWC